MGVSRGAKEREMERERGKKRYGKDDMSSRYDKTIQTS